MKRAILLLVLLVVPFAVAATCQYPTLVNESYVEDRFFLRGAMLDDSETPKITQTEIDPVSGAVKFHIHNPLWGPIFVNVTYERVFPASTQPIVTYAVRGNISSQDSAVLEGPFCYPRDLPSCELRNVELNIELPQVFTKRSVELMRTVELCELRDDGAACTRDYQCGGGYCVEGRCNNAELCYQSDCRCPEGYVQCTSDDRCWPVGTEALGLEPVCGRPETCDSGYVENGTCAIDPLIARESWSDLFRSGSLFAVLGLIFIAGIALSPRAWAEMKARAQERELAVRRHELAEEEERLKQLKHYKHEQSMLEREIKQQKERVDAERQKMRETLKHQREDERKYTKIRPSKILGSAFEYRDPEHNYYPCYANKKGKTLVRSGKPIHRHQAYRHIFQKHKDFFGRRYGHTNFKSFVVHHIDKDPDNYRVKNLAVLSWTDHQRVDHGRITPGDWHSGIRELKRLGLSQPHISETRD